MPRIPTAGFTYSREAFERAKRSLQDGEPSVYNDRMLVAATAELIAELDDKAYSDEEIVEALAAATAETPTTGTRAILTALVRRARVAEREARARGNAEAGKPPRTHKAPRIQDTTKREQNSVQQTPPKTIPSPPAEPAPQPHDQGSPARQFALEIAAKRPAEADAARSAGQGTAGERSQDGAGQSAGSSLPSQSFGN
jgi:hypothetical protein